MADDLKEIRESFTDDDALWHEIREARKEDIKALSPDSTWDDKDRQARKEAGRPCLSFDELSQYVNQLVNDIRSTNRAIEVNPSGDETTEHQARFIGALIRQIEYRSNAQLAYTQMFEDAAQGGYGFCRIVPRYIQQKVEEPSARSFDQELIIEPVHNPDLITPGYFTRPDFSDCKRFWVHERFEKSEFNRRFPEAKIGDLSDAMRAVGPVWVDDKGVWVRELWELKTRPKKILLLPDGPDGQPVAVWEDDVEKEQRKLAIRERTVEQPYVCFKLTNGLEILEEREDWPGRFIPIVGCVGKVLWMEDKRVILSLIRNARDPQQLYNYYRTTEAEMVGMTPKFPWFAYGGVLDGENKRKLALSNHVPVGVIELNAEPDGWNRAHGPAPPPMRNPYDPPIQAFEVGAESTRRAIMSATGTGFLPTEAQRTNQKSGVALREISTSAQKGAYHFIDHFEHSLRRVGEILVDLIPHYYDTARDVHVRLKDDTPLQVRINDPQSPAPKEFGGEPIVTTTGEFDITLSVGPSYDSEREKAYEFANTLISARPEIFQLIGPDVIRLANIGPLGDKMAEYLEAMQPPQIQQLRKGQQPASPREQQLMMQLKQAQMLIQQMQQFIAGEQAKGQTQIALKEMDGRLKLALERLKHQQKLEELKVEIAADAVTREDEQAHEMALKGADASAAEASAQRAAEEARRQMLLSGSDGGAL